jgi:hypothetical protein
VSRAPGFVLGYHGCDRDIGHKIVSGELPFTHSEKSYDWLGHGIYFWESDSQRALEWAQWKSKVGECPEPFVIGAVLDLQKCFDLLERENLDLLTHTYEAYAESRSVAGLPLPANKDSSKGASQNKVMRHLDCAVINHLHATMAADPTIEPFNSVRGLFVEGLPAYEGGEIYRLTHAQIAIRSEGCIMGVFLPR